jgi:VanZ family protein
MKPTLQNFLFYQLPPWVWGLGIFVGTSLPTEFLPSFVIFGPDKLFHVSAFLVLSILIFRALSVRQKPFVTRRVVIVSLIIAICFAIFDELHQYFIPGRFPDPYDIVADVLGTVLGVSLAMLYKRIRGFKQGQIEVDSERASVS